MWECDHPAGKSFVSFSGWAVFDCQFLPLPRQSTPLHHVLEFFRLQEKTRIHAWISHQKHQNDRPARSLESILKRFGVRLLRSHKDQKRFVPGLQHIISHQQNRNVVARGVQKPNQMAANLQLSHWILRNIQVLKTRESLQDAPFNKILYSLGELYR